jgi:hypothetical protein
MAAASLEDEGICEASAFGDETTSASSGALASGSNTGLQSLSRWLMPSSGGRRSSVRGQGGE